MKSVMSRKPNRSAIKNRRQKRESKTLPKKKIKSTPQDCQLEPYEKYVNVDESAYFIIFELGSLIGFSSLMLLIIKAWKSHNAFKNKPNSNVFTIGPMAAKVVKCKCGGTNTCKWCCGSGWLTRHVSKVKEIVEDQEILI